MEEEIRRNTRDGNSSKEVEKDCSLVNKEKKSMVKKSQGEVGKKKDMSNIKCFHCHEFGNYAMKCPQKKESKKELAIVAAGEALASQFELDFTLITCMESTVMGSMWYLDTDASFHITRNKDISSDLEECGVGKFSVQTQKFL